MIKGESPKPEAPKPKPFFGPERPPGAPLTGPVGPQILPAPRRKAIQSDPNITSFRIGDSSEPALDTKGMSCIDFQVALRIPNEKIEAEILSVIQCAGESDEAEWRAANPGLECPTEKEIESQMLPYIPGKSRYFFYSNFQPQKRTLAFKAANFPEFTHFSEVWKSKKYADAQSRALYNHLFAVRASKIFAARAEGDVVVILPPGNGTAKTWHLTSLWNIELAILMANPKVTGILRIDMEGNQSRMK